MQPSENAYELAKHFESLRLTSYADPVGIWTIGYGHTKRVFQGMKITRQEAIDFLVDDMDESAYEVNHRLQVDVSQNQFDALCDFVFNLGGDAFENSTLLRKLNAEDPKASEQLLRWVKAKDRRTGRYMTLPGLLRRRQSEKHLWETGELVFEFPRGEV